MAALSLTREAYRDRVLGGWLGKNAGTTLGAAVDGERTPNGLRFYDPTPGQAIASDELDFELVWLHALREHGPDITSEQLAEAWQAHIRYPWDEYGYSAWNVRRGLCPPITGAFNNWFRQGVYAASRADLWAMVAPGSPQVAAAYAYRDAILDHAEEGVWAAMMWAAMESAAFFVNDPAQLAEIGLAMVPGPCRTARAVRAALEARRADASWVDARGRVLAAAGSENLTEAPQNVGFAALGLLYGDGDFGRSLVAAVNCGYDTDSTGGMVGALLGIMLGRSGLPAEWLDPIGEHVVLGWGVADLDVERTVGELADHTIDAGARVIAAKCPDVALVEADPAAAEAPPAAPAPPTPKAPAAVPAGFSTPEPTAPEDAEATTAPTHTFVAPDLGEPSSAEAAAPAEPDDEPTDPEPATRADAETGDRRQETGDAGAAAADAASPNTQHSTLNASLPDFTANAAIKPLLVAPANTAIYRAGAFELVADYGPDGPAIVPNAATSFTVAIRNTGAEAFMGHVTLSAPAGWQVAVPGAQGQRQMLTPGGMARYGFVVRVPEGAPLEPRNTVTIVLTPEKGAPTTCDISFLGGWCWWFVGPFPNIGDEGFMKPFPVEDRTDFQDDYLGRAGGMIRWQKLAFRETVMPVEAMFSGTAGVVYGVTTIHVPEAREARIVAQTNDGVKVWLNRAPGGKPVLQRHSHEPFRPTLSPGPASVDVPLRAGDNQVMVKLVRCSAPIEFAFAVTDRDGRPLLDVGSTKW